MKVLRALFFIFAIKGLNARSGPGTVSHSVVTTSVVAPSYQCSHGYVPFNGQCVRSIVDTQFADVQLQCHSGYSLTSNGMCIKPAVSCLPGYNYNGYNCLPTSQYPTNSICPSGYHYNGASCVVTDVYSTPAISKCPEGYSFENSQCIKRTTVVKVEQPVGTPYCPSGFTMVNNMCQRRHVGSTGADDKFPSGIKPHSTLIEIERNNTIHILNDLNIPINVHNENNHTTVVNVDAELRRGQGVDKSSEVPEKCCEVVSPRMCKQKENKDWYCFHRRTEQCGRICTAPVIYLKPEHPQYQNDRMIIPPRHTQQQHPLPPIAMLVRSHGMCRGVDQYRI